MTLPTAAIVGGLPREDPPSIDEIEAEIERCFRVVAAYGLANCHPESTRPPDDERVWLRLGREAERQRMTGPLTQLVASGQWACPSVAGDEIRRSHRRAMALTLVLERDLLVIATDFDAAGIEFRVLKGSAIARLDEPDPAWRSFGDIDLLVRGDDLGRAAALMERRGGRRRYPEPRPGFDARFSKGSSYVFDRNTEVDLHRTLAAGPFGLTMDLDELFAHTETFTIAGRSLLALDRPSRFLHACQHAILGSPRPRTGAIRDIVRTAPVTAVDCRVALGRARRWRIEAVVAAAVGASIERVGWTPPAELEQWVRWFRPTARDQRWLDAYRGGHRSYAAQMINGIGVVPGLRDKLAYAVALTVPAAAPGRAPLPDRWSRGLRALPRTLRP